MSQNSRIKLDSNQSHISSNFLAKYRDKDTKKLCKFTAAQFLDVWNHYDLDGNGYIEKSELDNFLREFVTSVISVHVSNDVISQTAFVEMKQDFLDAYDNNEDGRIEIGELSQILPTEEEFLLLFQRENPLKSSVDFMKIWKKFDKDCSGFIEKNELEAFIIDLLSKCCAKSVNDYSEVKNYVTIMLSLFDRNGDGKLQLSEMARLLPIKENHIARPIISSTISYMELDRLFRVYDQDSNGLMDRMELQGLLIDLLELSEEPYNEETLENMQKIVLNEWDVNHDGMINKKELKMILTQHAKLGEVEKKPYTRINLSKNIKDIIKN